MPLKQSDRLDKIITTIAQHSVSKNTKRGAKALNKAADMSYLFAFPDFVRSVIERHDLLQNKDTFRILITEHNEKDNVDNMRWLAILPMLLGNPKLRIEVVVHSDEAIKDTMTHFRKLIDYIIHVELKDNFASTHAIGRLEEVIESFGDDGFDLVINNVSSVSKVESNAHLYKSLVSAGTPIVVSDVAPITLLNRTNAYCRLGITSKSPYFNSETGLLFGKYKSAQYVHFGYYVLFDGISLDPVSIDLEEIQRNEASIVNEMNAGDDLRIVPSIQEGKLSVFSGTFFNLETDTAVLTFDGNHYQLDCPVEQKHFHPNPTQAEHQAYNVMTSLRYYRALVETVKQKKVA